MDVATGAAVIVGLKTIGAPVAKLMTDFLGQVLTPVGTATGDVLAHPIREFQRRRVEQAARTLTDAALLLKERGLEPQSVPGRILWPILEKSSLEENDDLRRRWSILLANAASPTRGQAPWPAFPSMLSELSHFEVEILDWMKRNTRLDENGDVVWFNLDQMYDDHFDGPDIPIALDNLCRLRIITRNPFTPSELEVDQPDPRVFLTALGLAFISACSETRYPPSLH